MLAGARELALKTEPRTDPRNHTDRMKLIMAFCAWCGISLPDHDAQSLSLPL
jgi:hypothetical protein